MPVEATCATITERVPVKGRRELVTVIVPAYNVADQIEECLDCLTAQTYQNLEIVVADDSSTDTTWQRILEYSARDQRIVPIRNDRNLAQAATRNRCLQIATGKYVMLQDADDVCEPSRLEQLMTRMEEGDVDFVSSGHYLFDDAGILQRVIPRKANPTRWDFMPGAPFCHAATLFKRSALESVEGYRVSSETRRGEDLDLFMRLYAVGLRGANIPDVLYGYRVNDQTMLRRTFEYRIDECRVLWRGFVRMRLMPWALPFLAKPLLAHAAQGFRATRMRRQPRLRT